MERHRNQELVNRKRRTAQICPDDRSICLVWLGVRLSGVSPSWGGGLPEQPFGQIPAVFDRMRDETPHGHRGRGGRPATSCSDHPDTFRHREMRYPRPFPSPWRGTSVAHLDSNPLMSPMQMCLPAGIRIACPGEEGNNDLLDQACSREGVKVYSVVLTGGGRS